uniref:RING-type E3 ubiquitin transferase n=2 Tax=Oryza brachyantha TaxID=4533 RepID=J3LX29_ORYBR
MCADDDEERSPVPHLELFDCAFRALQAARSDEPHRGADFRKYWTGSVSVPEFFLCPISNKVMENPVVISSGKTVDVLALDKWWSENRRVCPVTDEILDDNIFIPNILIALCITLWRRENDIADVTAIAEPANISSDEEALLNEISLLAHSPSISDKTFDAILRLHELMNNAQCSFLHLLGRSPGMITKLACILPETCLDPDPELDGIILKIIAKTASYSPNKVILGDDRYAIPVLIARALLGPVATRVKCAQILGLLADNYYNKIKIGELGGFAALMELLLLVADRDVKQTVAMAIASLCEAQENWGRFLREGVADAAISLLRDDNLVDEARSILLQAKGFELAMTQILDKLKSFVGDDNCEKMIESLWDTFIQAKIQRCVNIARASASKRSASDTSSETSSEGILEMPIDTDLTEQTKKDIRVIVSWLQRRSFHPRTYRYIG